MSDDQQEATAFQKLLVMQKHSDERPRIFCMNGKTTGDDAHIRHYTLHTPSGGDDGRGTNVKTISQGRWRANVDRCSLSPQNICVRAVSGKSGNIFQNKYLSSESSAFRRYFEMGDMKSKENGSVSSRKLCAYILDMLPEMKQYMGTRDDANRQH